jgi:hypothetical protein
MEKGWQNKKGTKKRVELSMWLKKTPLPFHLMINSIILFFNYILKILITWVKISFSSYV